MNAKQYHPTEQDLKASLWWWHHSRFAFAKQPIFYRAPQHLNHAEWRDWREDGMERTAQGWELVRRVLPHLQWQPFYDLGKFIAVNLRARIIPESERFRYARMMTTKTSAPGWSDEDADGFRVNLRVTKDALRRQFALQFIPTERELSELLQGHITISDLHARLDQRKRELPSISKHLGWVGAQARNQGLELPRGLVGQHNRPPSWALVEVLDIRRYVATRGNPSRKLSAAERKMKTVATQKAKALAPEYVAAMEDIKRMPGYSEATTPSAIARDRRILLGAWEPPKTNW